MTEDFHERGDLFFGEIGMHDAKPAELADHPFELWWLASIFWGA